MSEPLRILQYITPSGLGGAELHVATLAERLRARGHAVTVICPHGRPLVGELAARGLPAFTPHTRGKLDPVTLARLVRWIRRERVDLIHTHLSTASLLGSWAARLAGVPCVATVHGLNTRTCFRWASRIVAVSDAVKRHLVEQGLPEARITVVHDGIAMPSTPRVDRAETRARWGIPAAAPVVIAVGRLSPEKGHRYLLEALALLARGEEWRDLRLLIVGAGALLEPLRTQAAGAGLAARTVFTGFQREVPPLLEAADVLALPSLREALSLSALEAMALGKPVVASRVGGTPEVVVEGETGFLVPPADPPALASALARLLRDPETARRMGAAGRERVRTAFDLDQMVCRLEAIYRELLPPATRAADRV